MDRLAQAVLENEWVRDTRRGSGRPRKIQPVTPAIFDWVPIGEGQKSTLVLRGQEDQMLFQQAIAASIRRDLEAAEQAAIRLSARLSEMSVPRKPVGKVSARSKK